MLASQSYWNRDHAGRQLARALRRYSMAHPLILALTSEGVVVARQVAERLSAELDALVVVEVTDPNDPGVTIGAVSEGGVSMFDRNTCERQGLDPVDVEAAVHRGMSELKRRVLAIRGGRPLVDVTNRLVIVVDDGIESGVRMSSAVAYVRRAGAARVVVAAPLGWRTAVENLQTVADEVVCPAVVSEARSIDDRYEEDEVVTDSEIATILRLSSRHDVVVSVTDPHHRGWQVHSTLGIPRGAHGVVVFAHGSGSSRLSPRNQEVAASLNEAGFATVLFDLLTEDESHDRSLVFDINYLAERLIAVVDWCAQDDRLGDLPLGLFGASTGAAAALAAAARRPAVVRAVVSRGGRPDLAETSLRSVEAPTLLIVGGDDAEVLTLNEFALERLGGPARLEIIPGATHLFEEPGAMNRVSLLAASWFDEFMTVAERVSGSLIRYRRTS